VSEEDAFLAGIQADRADRTRLLVFADWLAERGDPREEFVRLHAKLLDMDWTEPEFADRVKKWSRWVGSSPDPLYPKEQELLTDRWLDAVCRVCTSADVDSRLRDPNITWSTTVERAEYESTAPYDTVVLYNGATQDYATPLEFLAGTVLTDMRRCEWFDGATQRCYPITRGTFWQRWRTQLEKLSDPPPFPIPGRHNYFLGAHYLSGGWSNWATVAVYQHDYFAMFWSTTD
jgi:uncharacterized protein (TIGR02996 family)